jgi:ABC-type transport system substrate-binding protein
LPYTSSLRVPMTAAIWSLDPSLISTVAQNEVIPNIFEPLTRHTEGAGIRPWLAEDFRADDAGNRYYFRLRDNVRFHDGRKLTSRDVRYTFERLLRNEESESRWLLAPIRGARALIDGKANELSGFRILSTTEFLVDLEQPLSFFPALVAYEAACILPEGAELRSTDVSSLAGTGPFRVTSFEPGKRVELEANRDYWIDGVPKSSSLTFDFDVPPDEIARGFREGKYSMAWDLLPEDVEAFRRDSRFAATYRQTPLLATGILIFNIHRPPFDDESLRRRVAYAIDVDSIVPRNLGRLGVAAHGLIPTGLLGYEPASRREVTVTQPLNNVVRAQAMLHTLYEGTYAGLARDIMTTFNACGVELEVAAKRAEFLRANATEMTDVFFGRWVADYSDTDGFVYTLLHTDSQWGRMCGTPETDVLLERARRETDPRVRHRIYREVEAIIARRALIVPLFHEQAYRFAQPSLGGMQVRVTPPIVPYEYLQER